jgi:HD-GYP domain-containing protein (c-di-GMP phosphodiesterase class II)
MRKLHIRAVKPGDILAMPVYSENGNVLIGAGVTLTDRYIERLIHLGVDTLYIEDPMTEDIVPEDAIHDETRRQAVQSVYKAMNSLTDQKTLKSRVLSPHLGSEFRKIFGSILADLAGRKEVLVNLTNLHVADGYLFQHSVNVAVLAGIIGMAKGYNRYQLEELGVGALLFDIGMAQIPKELLNRNGPLTAEERKLIEKHTEAGFQLLRGQFDISIVSAHCALQHHERYNGTGYPRGLKKNEIHEYAQIVALADVFDALVSSRSYRKRYTPNEAIEYLFAAGNTLFDLELIRLFCRNIAIYPVATTVKLNTGHVAVVLENNPLAVHRPIVRIIQEPDGTDPASPYEIDLSYDYNMTIVQVF